MKRSQRLRLSEVREVFRVLGDAQDLRHDQVQQETVIVDAMTDLLGASFGYALRFEEFRPKAPTRLARVVPGTIQDPRVIHYFSEWGKTSEISDSPMMHATWNQAGPVYTTARSDLMTFRDIMPYRVYPELIEPAGILDVLMTFFRYPGSNIVRQYTFQRMNRQTEFEPRQLRLAHLFTTELHRLYGEGRLEPSDLINSLPQRLVRIAYLLRTNQNQHQIAHSLNLSYHTVRSYTKELYDTVDVNSREELVAKLFGRGGRNSNN